MIHLEEHSNYYTIRANQPDGPNLGDFVALEDGFYYYFMNRDNNGGFTAHNLREIADAMDKINAPWEQQINEYFEEQEKKC